MSEIDPQGISVHDLADSLGDESGEFDEVEQEETPEEEAPETEQSDEPKEGESEEGEDEESEPGEKFVIDGEEFDVPAELAPAAKKLKAFEEAVRADYTRKTQEAAAMRNQATQIQQRVKQEAEFSQRNIELLAEMKAIESSLAEYKGVDWAALAEQDIGAYSKHKEIRDGLRERYQAIGNEYGQRRAVMEQQAEAQWQQNWQHTVSAVKQAIPTYDATTDTKAVQTAVKLGEKYGIKVDPNDLSRELNPLVWIGLVELSKHFELQAKRPEVSKKLAAAPAPKQGRPVKQSRTQEAEKRLRSRGRVEDLAKFL